MRICLSACLAPMRHFMRASTVYTSRTKLLTGGALSLSLALLAAPIAFAQTRVALPAGTVIIVRTTSALESSTAKVGQNFETVVVDTIRVDNYTAIPAGSHIRGVV